MKIRKSTEQDFNRIMEIYAFAREYMKTHGRVVILMVSFIVWLEMVRKKELVPSALNGLFQNATTFA